MRQENLREILEKLEEEIKAMVKGLLERLMVEERTMYLDERPTKANGSYTRNLLTLHGPIEDLRVPRVRGDFRPAILPEGRRASLELSEGSSPLRRRGQHPASFGSWRSSTGRSIPRKASPA